MLKRQELKKWRDNNKHVTPLASPEDFALSRAVVDKDSMGDGSALGHMLTPDGRLALRVILDSEAQAKFGARGLSDREGVFLTLRLAQLHRIEDAALILNHDVERLTKLMKLMLEQLNNKKFPMPYVIDEANAIMKEIEGD